MAYYDKERGIVLSNDDRELFGECTKNVMNKKTPITERIMKWVHDGSQTSLKTLNTTTH